MTLTVVIPVFNEVDNLPELRQRLESALGSIDYEVIFVDDGSKDGSCELLKAFHCSDNRYKALFLSRNFGQQTAITAGLYYARGDAVAVIDADLQDPPELIPDFLHKLQQGYDVVYGIRKKRPENVFKRTTYFLFYRLFNRLSTYPVPLDAGDFCVMTRRMVQTLNGLPEHHRFLRGLRAWSGYKQIGLPYKRAERYEGKSKYTFGTLLNLALDGLISFSTIPVRLIIQFGLLSALSAFCLGLFYLALQVTGLGTWPSGFVILFLLICFFGGIQLVTIGIIGEYIGRIHTEVKHRPHFLISDYLGIPPKA